MVPAMSLLLAGPLSGRQEVVGKIGYISGSTVYIDIGHSDGLAAGDTLRVLRGGEEIGRSVVTDASSTASSCRPRAPVADLGRGDRGAAAAADFPAAP